MNINMNNSAYSFLMKIWKVKQVRYTVVTVLIVAIFVYDALSPVGVAFGFTYVLPLIIILHLNEKRYSILAPLVFTLLSLIGVMLKPHFAVNH